MNNHHQLFFDRVRAISQTSDKPLLHLHLTVLAVDNDQADCLAMTTAISKSTLLRAATASYFSTHLHCPQYAVATH
jgi:hypothetical protein